MRRRGYRTPSRPAGGLGFDMRQKYPPGTLCLVCHKPAPHFSKGMCPRCYMAGWKRKRKCIPCQCGCGTMTATGWARSHKPLSPKGHRCSTCGRAANKRGTGGMCDLHYRKMMAENRRLARPARPCSCGCGKMNSNGLVHGHSPPEQRVRLSEVECRMQVMDRRLANVIFDYSGSGRRDCFDVGVPAISTEFDLAPRRLNPPEPGRWATE